MIRVLANGCFDILHPGHVAHLRQARSFGDYLIVSLTTDEHVNKGPGRPIYKWEDRAALLRELRCVDEVVAAPDALQAIRKLRPDIFVKGIDYRYTGAELDRELCDALGIEMRITDTPKFSASDTIRKVIRLDTVHAMWERTFQSLPPRGEILAVQHKLSSRGEIVDEEAIWDGRTWTRPRDGEVLDKNYYFVWRRLAT